MGEKEAENTEISLPYPLGHLPMAQKARQTDPTTHLLKVLYGFQPSFSQYGGRPECLGRRGSVLLCGFEQMV